ncbi:MAG: flotillin family protein [Acidobacteriota bacterium]|nr:flotillin family protein [Acidobacteriota bacterium]
MEYLIIALAGLVVTVIGILFVWKSFYRKAVQGQALVKTGFGKTNVSFDAAWVVPLLHRCEVMDISVKRVVLERSGNDGLVCQDNMRADIKVAFFVRVNNNVDDVKNVATTIGVTRASDRQAINELFDPKFSEALKTAGKKFDFVDLYQERRRFKEEILDVIGTDLNGYILDDCAIDYLEQTDINNLSADNILDAEGIKKITELTANQKVLANQIDRDREKTIKQQDVEAQEAILELERQLAETQEKQKREVLSIKAREAAEAAKVQQEERLKAETARLQTEEEVQVATQNKERQVIVAQKNKERAEKIEIERIEKDRQLEVIERERVVELTTIEKERSVEVERKNIQDVIRDRVVVEKAVVEEEEKIKDTRAFAEAERVKQVTVTQAATEAEEAKVKEVKKAEAEKEAAALQAEQKVIEAEAARKSSDKNAEARKVLAEAKAAEDATIGLAEAQVQEAKAKAAELEGQAHANVLEKKALAEAKGIQAKADAMEKQGTAEASVMEKKAVAEANGIQVKADALEKQGTVRATVQLKEMEAKAKGTEAQGTAEAVAMEKLASAEASGLAMKVDAKEKEGLMEAAVIQKKAEAEARGEEARAEALERLGSAEAANLLKKFQADAQGIREKAEAMKLFDPDGRKHEEFKLELETKLKEVLASLDTQKDIAKAQAEVIAKGLEAADIEIVGGESMFFDRIANSIAQGRSVDRLLENSKALTDVKETFFNGDPEYFKSQLKGFVDQFGMSSADLKNLTISALIGQMMNKTDDSNTRGLLGKLLAMAESAGLGNQSAGLLG